MRGRPKIFDKLGGGLNLVDGYNAEADEAEDALNVTSDGQGGWRARYGSTPFVDVAGPSYYTFGERRTMDSNDIADMVIVYRPNAGTVSAISGDLIQAVNVDTNAITTLLNVAVTTDYFRPQFIVAPANGGQGPLYFMGDTQYTVGANPIEPLYSQWTGSGAAAAWTASAGSLPAGRFLIYANNRAMILSRDGTLTASDVGNPRDWDLTAGAWSVGFPPNGESTTGLGVAGDYVLVFQESLAWVVYDSETGANRRLDDSPGCGSQETICPSPYGTFFLGSDRRVYRTDGQSTKMVSRKIQPLLEDIVLPDLTGPYEGTAWGVFHGDSYYLWVGYGGAGGDARLLEYNVPLDAWWAHDWQGGKMSSMGGVLYGVNSEDIKLCTVFDDPTRLSDDDGTPLVVNRAKWQSAKVAFGSPGARSRVRAVDMDGSGATVEAGMLLDGAAASLAAPVDISDDRRILTPGVAKTWALRMESDDPMALNSWTAWVDLRKD